jgi:hypothetical protein
MQSNIKAFPRRARGALMVATYLHRHQGHGIWGGLASLLLIFSLVPIAWPWAGALPPGDIPVPRQQVAVHQGRLSVNL